MAFATKENQADYTLEADWSQDRWRANVLRRDSAFVYRGESPDYKRVLWAACRAIGKDEAKWPNVLTETDREIAAEATASREANAPADRFDLRDVHNGLKTTTAILDKRTGRVWVWTELTGSNGKSTGSAFAAEDIYGELGHSFSPSE